MWKCIRFLANILWVGSFWVAVVLAMSEDIKMRPDIYLGLNTKAVQDV